MNKANISVQTVFYIMMAMIFVWIMIFGFQKIFMIQGELSEQERREVTNNLKDAFEYCDDPLNKGNFQVFEVNSKLFNGVCVLGEDFDSNHPQYGSNLDWIEIKDAGKNVVLLNTEFIETQGVDADGNPEVDYSISHYAILDSFNLNFDIGDVLCWFDYGNSGKVEIEIECS